MDNKVLEAISFLNSYAPISSCWNYSFRNTILHVCVCLSIVVRVATCWWIIERRWCRWIIYFSKGRASSFFAHFSLYWKPKQFPIQLERRGITIRDIIKQTRRRYASEQYRELNKNKVHEACRQWRENNKDRTEAFNHQYYDANKQKYSRLKQTDIDFIIKGKIKDYRRAVSAAGRVCSDDDYITLDWVKDALIKCEYRCFHCDKRLKILGYDNYDSDQFTCDRLFNDMAHEKDNCVISCLACNLAHGDKDVF